jgi:hypothetical protein
MEDIQSYMIVKAHITETFVSATEMGYQRICLTIDCVYLGTINLLFLPVFRSVRSNLRHWDH